jgi:hypothetical protein
VQRVRGALQPPPVGGQVDAVDQRVGADAHAPDQRPGGDLVPGGQLHVAVPGLGDRLAGPDFDTAPAQDPLCGPRQPRVQFSQHPRRQVQQHPPDLLPGQAGQGPGQPGGQPLAVRGDLGTGIARADDHEGAARRSLGGVGGQGGQLELADDVVAQVNGFADGPEPVRVVGDTRDGPLLRWSSTAQHLLARKVKPGPFGQKS